MVGVLTIVLLLLTLLPPLLTTATTVAELRFWAAGWAGLAGWGEGEGVAGWQLGGLCAVWTSGPDNLYGRICSHEAQ
jgi:hypothetical protein